MIQHYWLNSSYYAYAMQNGVRKNVALFSGFHSPHAVAAHVFANQPSINSVLMVESMTKQEEVFTRPPKVVLMPSLKPRLSRMR